MARVRPIGQIEDRAPTAPRRRGQAGDRHGVILCLGMNHGPAHVGPSPDAGAARPSGPLP